MTPTARYLMAPIIALFSALVASPAIAQLDTTAYPDGQFGIGFETRGAHLRYALVPSIHVGIHFQYFKETSHCAIWDSHAGIAIELFTKYLLPIGRTRPFVLAAIDIRRESMNYSLGCLTDIPIESQRGIYLALGAEHFLNRNVGMYGQVRVIDIILEHRREPLADYPTPIGLGLMGGTAGVEFFF